MPGYYDKDKLKDKLDISSIYDLITEFGGEPEYVSNEVLISQTICHNIPGEGSRKLYYYDNTKLFKCYTSCDETFDLFQLVIKVAQIQRNKIFELYDAMNFVAEYFGLEGIKPLEEPGKEELEDWGILQHYKDLSVKINNKSLQKLQLKEYDPIILTRFSYPRIAPWEKDGISNEVCKRNLIGYYPGGEQITIPHFDIDGRFVGLRGRFLAKDDANRYGKYKPLIVNRVPYNHPLSANLYNLNNSKDNIQKVHVAIVFEGKRQSRPSPPFQ